MTWDVIGPLMQEVDELVEAEIKAELYDSFLASKTVTVEPRGIASKSMGSHMTGFRKHCVEFAMEAASSGLFLDTGLGKTSIELEFCLQALEESNGKALILTPLAVARQIEKEALRWGYPARVIRSQDDAKGGINICNYDRLPLLVPEEFGVVALDESSILKNFTGKTTRSLIDAFASHRWRLAATATPAPNDHMELGNHSEFLRVMPMNDMLVRWFINDASDTGTWRLKGHARQSFWDWMASWCRMAEHPRDLGDPMEGFDLPPLNVIRHQADSSDVKGDEGTLFANPDISATGIFKVKKQTADARAKAAVTIIRNHLGGLEREFSSWVDGSRKIASKKISAMPGSESDGQKIPKLEPKQRRGTKGESDSRSMPKTSSSNMNSELNGRTISPCSAFRMEPAPFVGGGLPETAESISKLTTAMRQGRSAAYSAIDAISHSEDSAIIKTICDKPFATSIIPQESSWVLWCDTNEEQQMLEKALGNLCISIYGSQGPDQKEYLHEAWINGERPVLLTKVSIFGYGMNWQHCHHMMFVGRTFSYETWYQAVRRSWRFGQTRPVDIHLIVAEGEDSIGRVIDRKADDHQSMKREMAGAMRRAMGLSSMVRNQYNPQHSGRLPRWFNA